MFIFERERETEREQGRSRERGRHRIRSSLQALSCQHRAWRGVRSWPELKLDAQPTEPPRHPTITVLLYQTQDIYPKESSWLNSNFNKISRVISLTKLWHTEKFKKAKKRTKIWAKWKRRFYQKSYFHHIIEDTLFPKALSFLFYKKMREKKGNRYSRHDSYY